MNLILHDLTKQQLDSLINSPTHAVLLVGSKGSGKRSIANYVAGSILQAQNIEDYPYGRIISSQDGKAIGIETVRELEHFLSLKVPGNNSVNRFMIFEDAHLLTTEAQNALLKTLEEPPQGSIIIMTTEREQALLPTIRSRAQMIKINKPTQNALKEHFAAQGHDEQSVKQSMAISGGLPGLMHTLLNEEAHVLVQATDYARQLLSKTPYERLLMVDELSKQRALSIDVCFILQQMAHVSLQKAKGVTAKRWQNILSASYAASEQLTQSAQPKLVLDKLMLSL